MNYIKLFLAASLWEKLPKAAVFNFIKIKLSLHEY